MTSSPNNKYDFILYCNTPSNVNEGVLLGEVESSELDDNLRLTVTEMYARNLQTKITHHPHVVFAVTRPAFDGQLTILKCMNIV